MLIKVDGGTHNKTEAKNKMHKTRRKILDVMNGESRTDTHGWRETQDERKARLSREESKSRGRKETLDEFRVPSFCPSCNKFMKNKFDTKFYYRTGHCFNCQQDFEHKLRVTGVYPLWERIKVFENEIDILREQHIRLTEAISDDQSVTELINSDGTITNFESAGTWESIKSNIRGEIAFIDETLPFALIELERMREEFKEKTDENRVE